MFCLHGESVRVTVTLMGARPSSVAGQITQAAAPLSLVERTGTEESRHNSTAPEGSREGARSGGGSSLVLPIWVVNQRSVKVMTHYHEFIIQMLLANQLYDRQLLSTSRTITLHGGFVSSSVRPARQETPLQQPANDRPTPAHPARTKMSYCAPHTPISAQSDLPRSIQSSTAHQASAGHHLEHAPPKRRIDWSQSRGRALQQGHPVTQYFKYTRPSASIRAACTPEISPLAKPEPSPQAP